MNSRSNASRAEKIQRRLEAGSLANHFPDVSGIVVSMSYSQRGMKLAMPRTVNFVPSSYAIFSIDCLSKGCVDGGFDLTHVIAGMVRNRKESTKGELTCVGGPAQDHSSIAYEVAIQYAH
ncbi:MAG TPA: hypothetical protein VLH56_06545 [Dissulfurispiraceae bacterium]|nr:hypothetical protein [Dissulfurispiraceae bacterium]